MQSASLEPVRWQVAEVLDFEHFAAQGAGPDDARQLAARLPADARQDRRRLFLAWVALRRERHGTDTPGRQFERALRMLQAGLGLAGLLAGAALAGTWLSAGSGAPVNALLFWAGAVGLQLLLLAALLLGWLLRGRAIGGAFTAAVRSLWLWAARRASSALPGPRRDELAALLARGLQRGGRLQAMVTLPAAAATQRFAVAFNLGLLLAMLGLHLPVQDVRFGWQSTYPLGAPQLHAGLRAVAAPWRWAWPAALPDEAEVAASRYSPGQPAYALPAGAAHAWWPFLVASVLAYGLLPRLLLLAALRRLLARRLAVLRFDDTPEAQALWRRLRGGLFEVQGGDARLPGDEPASTLPVAAEGDCLAWVEPECLLPDEGVRAAVLARLGWHARALWRLPVDDRVAAAPQLAAQLPPLRPGLAGVAVVVPAARDPIVAIALFLRMLCEVAGPGVAVVVLLAGADAERLAIWRRFAQIQHLPVGVEVAP